MVNLSPQLFSLLGGSECLTEDVKSCSSYFWKGLDFLSAFPEYGEFPSSACKGFLCYPRGKSAFYCSREPSDFTLNIKYHSLYLSDLNRRDWELYISTLHPSLRYFGPRSMFFPHSRFRNHSLDFWRLGISFHETPLSADDREAYMYAKSGHSQPGILWPEQSLRHRHTTLGGGTVSREGDGGKEQLENWGPACSAFLPTSKGLVNEMVLCSLLPRAF